MKKQSLILTLALVVLTFFGCKPPKEFIDSIKATPNPAEYKGGKIEVVFEGSFPDKYFGKKMTMQVVPVLTTADGKVYKAAPVNYQGEKVKDNSGNLGVITDYFLVDGKKAKVQITYQDGTSQIREKYAVERGSFQKPFLDETEKLLKTGEWDYIPDFNSHYIINKNGEIRTCYGQYKGKILSPYLMSGYMTIALQQGETKDTRKLCRVHTLVASTFIRQIQKGEEVNHINGVKHDNRAENLEWCTSSENKKHAWDTGLRKPYVVTEEIRLKMSKSHKGKPAWNRGFPC